MAFDGFGSFTTQLRSTGGTYFRAWKGSITDFDQSIISSVDTDIPMPIKIAAAAATAAAKARGTLHHIEFGFITATAASLQPSPDGAIA